MVEMLKGRGSLKMSDGKSLNIGVTTPLRTLPLNRSSGVGRIPLGVKVPGSIASSGIPSPGVFSPGVPPLASPGVPSPGVFSPGVPPLASPLGYTPEGSTPMNGLTTPTGDQTTFWNEQEFWKWFLPGEDPPPPPRESPEDVPPPVEPDSSSITGTPSTGSILGIDYLTLLLGVILAVLLFTGGKKR